MREGTIDLKTPDGVMPTYTFDPGSRRRQPVVVFFMDGLGVRGTLLDMARRVASDGYYVALPNLFYRSGPHAPFEPARVFGDAAERERLMGLVRTVTPALAVSDMRALLDRLRAEPSADAGTVGTVGYCMGGGPAISAAGAFPGCVRAAASYHGGRLATDAPDSPHVLASTARGRLYIGYAENDPSFPEPQRAILEAALDAARVPYETEMYKAAHGFTMADFPVYDTQAANRHWETLLALFRQSLQ